MTSIGPSGSHIGYKETMKDTACVLGRMYDGIEYRGFTQTEAEELARRAGVPMWTRSTRTVAHRRRVLSSLLRPRRSSATPSPVALPVR